MTGTVSEGCLVDWYTGNTGNTDWLTIYETSQSVSDWLRIDFRNRGYSLGHRDLRAALRRLRIETGEKGRNTKRG